MSKNATSKSESLGTGGKIVVSIIILLIIYALYYHKEKDDEIGRKKKTTVAKITKISTGDHSFIRFVYFINGKKYKGQDRYGYGYPPRIRLGTPDIRQYHVLEYDSTNHENNRLVVNREPLDPMFELNYTQSIEGCVKKQMNIDQYTDLYIDYKVKGDLYSFRTRLHKDSLNIYETDNCYDRKAISIEVSKRHPFFNNLYFQSHDRQYKRFYSTQ